MNFAGLTDRQVAMFAQYVAGQPVPCHSSAERHVRANLVRLGLIYLYEGEFYPVPYWVERFRAWHGVEVDK